MFTPEEHEWFRFLDTNTLPTRYEPQKHKTPRGVGWRVYGDKTNQKTGEHRRYFKCTACLTGRRIVIRRNDVLVSDTTHIDHAPNCYHLRKTED